MDEMATFERTSRASKAPLKLDAPAIGVGLAVPYQ